MKGTQSKNKAKKRSRRISGIEDIANTASNVMLTKMRYDFERSLTPQERKQRYEDQKRNGRVALGIFSAVVLIVVAVKFSKH